MLQRARDGGYAFAEECLADARLIHSNALRFNGAADPIVAMAERVERDAATVCECRRGSRRCALFVERGVDRWTAALDALLGLRVDELVHQHGKTAGRGICVQRAVRQAGGFESRTNACGERTLEFGQRERRQFFGAEFEQKVARTHAAPLWATTIGKPRVSRDS